MKPFHEQFKDRIDMYNGSVILREEEYVRICQEAIADTGMGKLLADLRDYELPRNPDAAYVKLKDEGRLRIGSKVAWYFQEDLEFWARWNETLDTPDLPKVPLPENLPYQGIVVPAPDTEIRGHTLEADEAVVVQFGYPTEKCYPDSQWFTLTRLLDNPDLVEVIVY